ncbi:hypothetical protein [Enterobacter cloacae]|uniref:hypothetical protein n=1 Tax=Enterobacter cloacae TaxID=550 RepID=UPI0029307A3E|nr:hypothetical protein [Enterobacter cloacae]
MKPANLAPVYCALYPALAEIARKHGYAMAIHGTMARDFDLICIPWVETPSKPEEVVAEITATYATTDITNPGYKHHGRLAYSVCFGFGEWIGPYISIHFLSLNPLLVRRRRYSRGERYPSALCGCHSL